MVSDFNTLLQHTILPTAVDRLMNNRRHFAQQFPSFGNGSGYYLTENRDWLASFLPGLLWLAYAADPQPPLRDYAESLLPSFEQRLIQRVRLNHDLGFIFTLSARAEWQMTDSDAAYTLALRGAEELSLRYRPVGNYIQAWGALDDPEESGRFIIDCMMNLPLLFWAAAQTGKQHYYEVAFQHALTSLRYLVRDDSSTYHTFLLDPKTGEPIGPKTHQGYADDSFWTRGQGWGIYGFTLAAEWTGDGRFLNAACQLSERLLQETDLDTIPAWDLRLPTDAPQYPDSSAAAIAAGGMLRLSRLLSGDAASRIRNAALSLLKTLTNQAFDNLPNAQGLLRHGTQHAPKNLGVDSYTIFGDYFFLEAVLMQLEIAPDFWGPLAQDVRVESLMTASASEKIEQ